MPKLNMWRAWSSKSTFSTSLYSRQASFFSSSSIMMINPYSEYRGAYGGGANDRVEWKGVWFLLGGAVSSSILRGDSETEFLLEEVVDDGLDDKDPFLLVKRLVVFFHMVAALSLTNIYIGFSTGNKVHKYYLEYGL
jgi:hypothetical protein